MAGSALTTALGWESVTRLVMAARAGRSPRNLVRAEFVHVPHRLAGAPVVTDRLISVAHELGLKVFVWTVDAPSLMQELLDRGVDGIITDRPDLLHEVVLRRGRALVDADPVTSISLGGRDQLV
jgi:glycerophosphoryl diester phosphodiesterase